MIGLPNVTSIYVLVAFGIACWILNRFLFAPLSSILEARENEEREAEKAHAASLQSLEQAVAAGEERLVAARHEALKSREDIRAEAMSLLEQKLAEARHEAADAMGRAAAEIDTQVTRSKAELPERAKSLARDLAEKILGRKLAA